MNERFLKQFEQIRVMSVGVAALEGTYGTQFTLGNAADVLCNFLFI